jgi:hypothetical protein
MNIKDDDRFQTIEKLAVFGETDLTLNLRCPKED